VVIGSGPAMGLGSTTTPLRPSMPLGVPAVTSPAYFQGPTHPVSLAQSSFAGQPEMLPPGLTLYRQGFVNEQPPLSAPPAPEPAFTPPPPAASGPLIANEPEAPSMSPFNPVGAAPPEAPDAANPPANTPAGQPEVPATAPVPGPTYITGGYGPAVGSYGSPYGYSGFGGSPVYRWPPIYNGLPNGYPVLGPAYPFGGGFGR